MIRFLSLPIVLLLSAISFQSTVLRAQIDNKQLLVADSRPSKIVAYDLNGERFNRMVVDSLHQQLIFSASNGIYSISFDGATYDTLYQFPSDHYPFALLLEPGTDYLYWTDYSIDEVRCGTIFGDPFITIVDGLDTPTGIAFTCLNNSQYVTCRSESITANFNADPIPMGINIYPNPTAQSARLSINLEQAHELSVSIRSIQKGQADYLMKQIHRPAGNWQFYLDTSTYPSGTYILTVETDLQRSSHKLVIIR